MTLIRELLTNVIVNNFFAVQNLKMALNWVYIFPSCFFGTYSDVLCSEECQTKKLLVCCKMFAFFKAIFKCYCFLTYLIRSMKPCSPVVWVLQMKLPSVDSAHRCSPRGSITAFMISFKVFFSFFCNLIVYYF